MGIGQVHRRNGYRSQEEEKIAESGMQLNRPRQGAKPEARKS
ncbi:hypothetical protein CSC33_0625 [Pseudomonas aeruginosa]|nr:hypothetical protein CSC33_0625 [Pseudomonas aeruginosa]